MSLSHIQPIQTCSLITQKNYKRPSTSVNGDIAIQWEWSNFDSSQNQNPLTDYDKTLHNSLRPRDEHVTQNLCQSTLRERLGKYVKYKALSFFILIYFFPDSPTEPIRGRIFTQCLKLRAITQGSAFLGSARWPKTFRGSNSPKTVKIGR